MLRKLNTYPIMKKIFSILFVAVCLFTTNTVQAQVKLGVKGGLNLANIDFKGLANNVKTENRNGFFIGPMVDINVPIIGIGIDGALLYAEKGTKFTNITTNTQTTNNQKTFEVPVNLKYSIGMGNMASIFFAAGPNFSFDINNDNLSNDLYNIANNTVSGSVPSFNRKKTEVSVNIGGGLKLFNHLQVGLNYNLPLTDSAKQNFAKGDLSELTGVISGSSFKSKTKVWQVSVAYLF